MPFDTIIEVIIQYCHTSEKAKKIIVILSFECAMIKTLTLHHAILEGLLKSSQRDHSLLPIFQQLDLQNCPVALFCPYIFKIKVNFNDAILKKCSFISGNCLHLLSCMTPKCVWAWLVGWRHPGISSTSPKPPIDINGLENVLLTTFPSKIALTARSVDWGNIVYNFREKKYNDQLEEDWIR